MAASKENCSGGYVVEVINEVDKNKFQCMFCLSIIKKATHGCTSHVFCFDCLQEYIESNKRKEIQKCPAGCQQTFNINELSSNNPYDQLINQIDCLCPFCEWKGDLLDFIQSHEGKCEEKNIPCHLCNISLKRKNMTLHLKDKCSHRPVACQGCEMNFPFVDHLKHEESCDDIKVQCSFTSFGCNVEGTRRNMIAHENNSCQQHLSLIVNYVTDENKLLKEETKQFKEEINELKEENMQVKEETAQLKHESKQLKEKTCGAFKFSWRFFLFFLIAFYLSSEVKEEIIRLKEGTKQLKEEIKQLKEESIQVREETKQLKEEIIQVREENKQLKDETKQLKKLCIEETMQVKEENNQIKEENIQLKEESIQVREEIEQINKKAELKKQVNIPHILLIEPANKYFHFPAVDEMHIKNIDTLSPHEIFSCFHENLDFTLIIERLTSKCDVWNSYKQELHKLLSSIKTIIFNFTYKVNLYFFHIDYFKDYNSGKFTLKKDGNIFYIEQQDDYPLVYCRISKWFVEINKSMMQIDITKPDKHFKEYEPPYLSTKYFMLFELS